MANGLCLRTVSAIAVLVTAAALPQTLSAAPPRSARPAETAPYTGVVEAVVNGTRSALEQQSVQMRIKAGAMQIGAPEVYYEMHGVRSPLRIQANGSFHFLARSLGDTVDPSTIYKLYRAEPKKKKYRRIKISRSSFSESMTLEYDREMVPVRFEHGRNSVLRIYPQQPLPPGEYAFVSVNRAFAFGID